MTLRDFFTQELQTQVLVTGDLAPSLSAGSYSFAVADDVADLEFFGLNPLGETFDVNSPALTGVSTIDLSGEQAFLPGVGDEGLIRTFNSDDSTFYVLGNWRVVSEPSSLALLPLMGLTIVSRRNRNELPTAV